MSHKACTCHLRTGAARCTPTTQNYLFTHSQLFLLDMVQTWHLQRYGVSSGAASPRRSIHQHCNVRLNHVLGSNYFSQSRQQPINFFNSVVMYQTNTQHAAILLHTQTLGQIHGIVVAIPHKNTLLTQALS